MTSRGIRVRLFGVIAFSLVGILVACGGGTGNTERNVIKVGAVIPLTGAQAAIGQAWKAGIELGVDKVNSTGGIAFGGKKYTLDVDMVDDESTPAGAQRGIEALLSRDITIFLGPGLSSSFATAYGVLKEAGKHLVLTPAAASEAQLAAGSLLFKTQGSQTGGGIVRFAQIVADEYQAKTVAILEPQNPTGDIIIKGLSQGFAEAGVRIVYKKQFDLTTTNFGPFLSAVRRADPDVFVGPYIDAMMAPLVDQAVQMGYTDVVYANYGGSRGSVAKHEDAIKQYMWQPITRAVDNAADQSVAPFRDAYKRKYGKDPASIDFFALGFYDPILMLREAIQDAGGVSDLHKVASAMRQVKNWEGQLLPFSFDEKGLAHYTYQIGKLSNGTVSYTDHGQT